MKEYKIKYSQNKVNLCNQMRKILNFLKHFVCLIWTLKEISSIYIRRLLLIMMISMIWRYTIRWWWV